MYETPIDPKLPILGELGQALYEGSLAAERSPAAAGRSRVGWVLGRLLRRPLLALPLIAVAGGGAVALAATGVLQSGRPVPATAHLTRNMGLGVPTSGHSQLITMSAPDPAGGQPWSMRIVRTSRDLVCVQIGRLQNGQIGVIGEDGSFHDDGRFHPLPPNAISAAPRRFLSICQPAGGTLTQELSGMPASGELPGAGTLGKPAEERRLYFGMLGPDALSLTYRLHGRSVTMPVERGTGAYLIVLPGARPAPKVVEDGGRSGTGRFVPAGVLTEITYRLGSGRCEERAIGSPAGQHPCPHQAALEPPVKPHDLQRPIHVTLRAVHGRPPVGVPVKSAHPFSPPPKVAASVYYEAIVTFVAPFAVRNALSSYSIAIPTCPSGINVTALERNVRAGTRVRARVRDVFANSCGRRARIEVRYHGKTVSPPSVLGEETLVGTATVTRP